MSRAGTRQRPSGASQAQSQPRATQRTQRNRVEETEDEEEDGDATMDVDDEENEPRDDVRDSEIAFSRVTDANSGPRTEIQSTGAPGSVRRAQTESFAQGGDIKERSINSEFHDYCSF